MNLLLSRPVKAGDVTARRNRKENDIMKANLKKTLGLAALGMALLATAAPSWAGFVSKPKTAVGTDYNTGRNYATGSLVGTRYSADTSQQIGCYIMVTQIGGSVIKCYARDSAGRTLECFTYDPVHVAIVHGMTDSSEIYFEKDPATGRCVNLRIYDSSMLLR